MADAGIARLGPMTAIQVRREQPEDVDFIRTVTAAAFAGVEESDGSEPFLVDKLRAAGALALSLVAVDGQEVVGHLAASAVSIGGHAGGWYGIGPVSVRPDHQQRGVGIALMGAALEHLRAQGSGGAVLLGDPGYYRRFGFAVVPGLVYPGAPAEYFMAVRLGDTLFPQGAVEYHPAFG